MFKIVNPKFIEDVVCEELNYSNLDQFLGIKNYFIKYFQTLPAFGLAAIQVGYPFKFFIWKIDDDTPEIFLNPKYEKNGNNIVSSEMCLSYPNQEYLVDRFSSIKAYYQIIEEDKIKDVETIYTGIKSIVFQHETDHIGNGEEKSKTIKMLGKLVSY